MLTSSVTFASALLLAAFTVEGAAIEPRKTAELAGFPGVASFDSPGFRAYLGQESSKVGPCGGATAAVANATAFPISSGPVSLIFAQDAHDVQVSWARTNESNSQASFQTALPTLDYVYAGSNCRSTDSGYAMGFAVGDAVTFQLRYKTGRTGGVEMFQCADVYFTTFHEWIAPRDYTCANVVANTVSTSDELPTSGGLSKIAVGLIGALVPLAFIALVVGGFFMYKKKRAAARSNVPLAEKSSAMAETTIYPDDASSINSMYKA